MCDILKNEFRLKNAWFGHDKPEAFYSAQVTFFCLLYTFRSTCIRKNIIIIIIHLLINSLDLLTLLLDIISIITIINNKIFNNYHYS